MGNSHKLTPRKSLRKPAAVPETRAAEACEPLRLFRYPVLQETCGQWVGGRGFQLC